MATKRDYYEVMGLSRNATDDEIKKAYRKLAKKYHPDLNQGNKNAEVKFKEIGEAYEVLSNKESKTKYDNFGHQGVEQNYGGSTSGGYSYYQGSSPFGEDFDISDIFGSIFGNQRSNKVNPNAPRKGSDIEINLNISFEEAAKGCKKNISYNLIGLCSFCNGNGCAKGTSPKICTVCKGSGQIKFSKQSLFGIMQSLKTCSACSGKGKIIEKPCKNCSGSGYQKIQKDIELEVPEGIDNNQILKITGKGNAGKNSGLNGDLHVYINVSSHSIFTRKNSDIWCEVPITFTQATLGAEITVPTIDGKVKYKIHEGTQPGDIFKLKGKGIKSFGYRHYGDQYVKINIEIPKYLSEKQKTILKDFESEISEKNYQKRKGFFDKLRDLF